MSDNTERRAETRLGKMATVFVELCAAAFDDDQPAEVMICTSLDISANGIQVQMDKHVPVGSILRLCAEFGTEREPIYLVGEVKWVKPGDGDYMIGFQLYESDHTDIVVWKEVVASMLQN